MNGWPTRMGYLSRSTWVLANFERMHRAMGQAKHCINELAYRYSGKNEG
jgi:hypothetical protein